MSGVCIADLFLQFVACLFTLLIESTDEQFLNFNVVQVMQVFSL